MGTRRKSLDENGLCVEAAENEVSKDDLKEQIIDAIGGFGKWQQRKCLFILLIIWTPASFHLLNMIFFRFGNRLVLVSKDQFIFIETKNGCFRLPNKLLFLFGLLPSSKLTMRNTVYNLTSPTHSFNFLLLYLR